MKITRIDKKEKTLVDIFSHVPDNKNKIRTLRCGTVDPIMDFNLVLEAVNDVFDIVNENAGRDHDFNFQDFLDEYGDIVDSLFSENVSDDNADEKLIDFSALKKEKEEEEELERIREGLTDWAIEQEDRIQYTDWTDVVTHLVIDKKGILDKIVPAFLSDWILCGTTMLAYETKHDTHILFTNLTITGEYLYPNIFLIDKIARLLQEDEESLKEKAWENIDLLNEAFLTVGEEVSNYLYGETDENEPFLSPELLIHTIYNLPGYLDAAENEE